MFLSRVGGLINSQRLYPFMYRGGCSDFNNATDTGYYNVGSSTGIPNAPNGAYKYGTLVVVGETFKMQIYFPDTWGEIYRRNKFGDEWRNWYKFTGTQV